MRTPSLLLAITAGLPSLVAQTVQAPFNTIYTVANVGPGTSGRYAP